jgi:hypothetical protein
LDQNGSVVRARLADVEAKVFDSENKPAQSTPNGTEVVIARQTDGTLRQVALTDIVPALNITNAKISNSAAIVDSKLATIDTAGKVTNNAVQATSTNTASRIVARDGSGNFSAGTITATLSGNATTAGTATTATTANKVANTLTRGTYLTGNNFDGSAATTWAVDAATANTASKVVARDGSGNFAAGTITASLIGAISTPNNAVGVTIGDDARLADRNAVNTVFLEGVQNSDRGYINFSSTTGNALGAVNGGNLEWRSNVVLHAGNYNSYAPTLTGGGASGAWNIRAYPRRANDGTDLNFWWSGQGGQPTWLWGGNDGVNMYVYNPSNFSVNYANSAGTVSDGAITDAKVSGTAAIAGSKINPNFSSAIQINGVQIIGVRPLNRFGESSSSIWTEATNNAGASAAFPTSTATLDTTKQYLAAVWNILRYHGLVNKT